MQDAFYPNASLPTGFGKANGGSPGASLEAGGSTWPNSSSFASAAACPIATRNSCKGLLYVLGYTNISDGLIIFAVLGIGLLIISLVGHGIWVLAAALLRIASQSCPRCKTRRVGKKCQVCGWPGPMPDPLQITQEQIKRLQKNGRLDVEVCSQVLLAISADRSGEPSTAIPMAEMATREISPVLVPPPLPPAPQVLEPEPPIGVPPPPIPAESPPPPLPPAPPKPHSKPLTQIMASFMEAGNIRWGELVGGLLIVGCSAALVVSLWSQIAHQPILKFLIFNVVTAALFGLGLYSHHRWRLPLTSRGILVTAALLVPLTFLASAAFSESGNTNQTTAMASQAIAIVLFALLLWFSGRVIAAHDPLMLVAAVLGPSIVILVVHYVAPKGASIAGVQLLILGALALFFYELTGGWMMVRAWHWGELETTQCHAILRMLGIASFCTALPLGLLIYKSGVTPQTFQMLGPLASLAGLPPLAIGLLFWRRLQSLNMVTMRTGGTSVAVVGAALLLGAIVLSWPIPGSMFVVALIDFVVMAAIAVAFELPAAHLPAGLCLMLAYLLGFHLASGSLTWNGGGNQTIESIFAGNSATALIPYFVLLMAVAQWLFSIKRTEDARFVAAVAAISAIFSLALVAHFAYFTDAGFSAAAWVFGVYTVAAMAAAWRFNASRAAYAGWILLLCAAQQWCAEWMPALLIVSTVAGIATILCANFGGKLKEAFGASSRVAAGAGSTVALVLLGMRLSMQNCDYAAWRLLWIASIWAAVAIVSQSTAGFAAFQAAITGAAMLAVTGRLSSSHWGPFDPRTLQAYGIATAFLCLIWSALRLTGARRWMPGTTYWSLDRTLTCAAIALLCVLAFGAAIPAVFAELAASNSIHEARWFGALSPYAYDLHSWFLLVVLAGILLLQWRDRPESLWLCARVAVAFAICPLLAVRWEGQNATASAFRWIAGVYLVAGTIPVWTGRLRQRAGNLILITGAGSILLLTLYPALLTIGGQSVAGPRSSSFFAHIGNSASYLLPLALVIFTLLGHAICLRSAGYAFGAGLVVNLSVTLGYLLANVGAAFGPQTLIQLSTLNAIALAAFALGWLGAIRLRRLADLPGLLRLEVWLAIAGVCLLVLCGDLLLLGEPGAATWPGALGEPLEWLAAILAGAAFVASSRRISLPAVAGSLLIVAGMGAQGIRRLGTPWDGYHALMAGHAAAAWSMLAIGWMVVHRRRGEVEPAQVIPAPESKGSSLPLRILNYHETPDSAHSAVDQEPVARWAIGMGMFAAVLALRVAAIDPGRPGWTAGILLVISILAVAGAYVQLEGVYLYAAAALYNLATTLWWASQHWVPGANSLADMLNLNVIALALPAIAWLVLELQVFRPAGSPTSRLRPIHFLAAIVSLITVLLVVGMGLQANSVGQPLAETVWIGWGALAATGALWVGCLWDPDMRTTSAGLYLLGLASAGLAIGQFHLRSEQLAWHSAIILAAYGVVTGYLFRIRTKLRDWGIPCKGQTSAATWLIPANLILAVVIAALGYWLDFELSSLSLRLVVTSAVVSQALAIGLLGSDLEAISLIAGIVGSVAWGWAWLAPGHGDDLLNRLVVAMSALVIDTAIYAGLGVLADATGAWGRAVRRVLPGLVATALTSLLTTLGCEVWQRVELGHVSIAPVATGAVMGALALGIVAAIMMAVSPRRDPLHLSDQGRTLYVYAAEALMAMTFVHLRLTMPWIFGGIFQAYWPLVVVAIAFGSVGLSEFFRRSGRMVLAEPLERTGAFLPLLPALGFWALRSDIDYSLLLLIAGILYSALAVFRKSFAMGLLAALAGNGALWYRLGHVQGFGVLQHPQCWLIPAALSGLAAGYLNRSRLSKAQMQAIHYGCLMTIYVSSTGDLFINGVARVPGLALVLGGLSVMGVMAGIMLRIRSFLFLGTSFLLLTLVTIIWHASVDLHQTWLIWVSGIALGLAIILMFAFFEKNRTELLTTVEHLKDWQG